MKKLHHFAICIAGAAMLAVAAGPAVAECPAKTQPGAEQATKTTKEIVANPKTDPETGQKEATTGPAKPTENWFGCKPGEKKVGDKCESVEGGQQEKKADAKTQNKAQIDPAKAADPAAAPADQAKVGVKPADCPDSKVKG